MSRPTRLIVMIAAALASPFAVMLISKACGDMANAMFHGSGPSIWEFFGPFLVIAVTAVCLFVHFNQDGQ